MPLASALQDPFLGGILDHVGGSVFMAGPPRRVSDECGESRRQVASHFERAKKGGASLLSGVESGPEGSLLYRTEDVEGHRWMFMQRATDR